MVLYIAADPGKDGAIACIDQDSKLISRISTPRISASGPVDLTKNMFLPGYDRRKQS